jgi:hypothetical protein
MFRKGSMCFLPGVLGVGGWRWLAQAVGRIVGVHILEASQLLLLLGGGRGRRQRPQLHLLTPSRLLQCCGSGMFIPDPGS